MPKPPTPAIDAILKNLLASCLSSESFAIPPNSKIQETKAQLGQFYAEEMLAGINNLPTWVDGSGSEWISPQHIEQMVKSKYLGGGRAQS